MLYIANGLHPRRRHAALTVDEFSGALPGLEEKSGYPGRARPLNHATTAGYGRLGGSVYTAKKDLSIMLASPWPPGSKTPPQNPPRHGACSGEPAAPVLRLLHHSPASHKQRAPKSSVRPPQRP